MPLYLQDWNWSDLLYGLIPLFYIIAQFVGSKAEKKSEVDPEEQKRAEAELAERRRRIQEEIRRRIAGQEATAEAAPQVEVAPARPTGSRRVLERTPAREVQPSARSRPVPVPSERTTTPVEGYGSDIERRLAIQREELERSRSARDAAHRRADEITAGALGSGADAGDLTMCGLSSATKAEPAQRKALLHALSSHQNIRTAVVMAEILGPPMASRSEIGERLF